MRFLNSSALWRAMLAAGLACAGAAPALAQTATSGQNDPATGPSGGQPSEQSAADGGDIVVTAQKREERVQDIAPQADSFSSSRSKPRSR